MDPINILHVNAEMDWGGGETQTSYLIRALRDHGYRQSVACQPGSAIAQWCAKEGLPVHLVRMRNELSFGAVRTLRRVLKTGHFKIVHFHTSRAHTLGALAALGTGPLRRVVTRRMEHRTGGWWKVTFLYNWWVDAVVAISDAVKEVLLAAGVSDQQIRVISSGVDVKKLSDESGRLWRNRLALPQHAPVVGFVGKMTWRKGIETLLRAAPRILEKHSSCRFLLVGNGPCRKSLEKLAAELKISDHVAFAGIVEEVSGILAAMDLFVLPSLKEGLGVSILEAMAAAKPVVASRVGGLTESVIDGETGFLVPAGDHEVLSRSLLALLDDRALRDKFGRAGRERVCARFSAESMALQYEALYRELLGNPVNST